ncbi:MAG: hypothetical protein ACKV2T_35260 [Kofleriaceae bacterium]
MTRFVLLVGLVVGACSSPAKPTTTTTTTTPADLPTTDDPSCPLLVPGTSISVEDSTEGPAFVFVTTGDVAQVRTRGQALAATHNERKGSPDALGMMFSAKSTAKAADVEGGVRVTFTPTAPATNAEVGDELRMHGGHLSGASSCKM